MLDNYFNFFRKPITAKASRFVRKDFEKILFHIVFCVCFFDGVVKVNLLIMLLMCFII